MSDKSTYCHSLSRDHTHTHSQSLSLTGAHFHSESLDLKAMNVIRQTTNELAVHDVEQTMDSNITVRAKVSVVLIINLYSICIISIVDL